MRNEENDALRMDAKRYRWLRDKSESVHSFYLSVPVWFSNVQFRPQDVDGAIDASMTEELKQLPPSAGAQLQALMDSRGES